MTVRYLHPDKGASRAKRTCHGVWTGGAQFETKEQFHAIVDREGAHFYNAAWENGHRRIKGEAVVIWQNKATLEILFKGESEPRICV